MNVCKYYGCGGNHVDGRNSRCFYYKWDTKVRNDFIKHLKQMNAAQGGILKNSSDEFLLNLRKQEFDKRFADGIVPRNTTSKR